MIVASLFTAFMVLGWLLIAGWLAFQVKAVSGVPYLFGLSFLGLLAIFWTYGMKLLYSRLVWPVEFYCDEIATLYLGEEATKEELSTLRQKLPRFWSTHPPLEQRLKRVEIVGRKHPKPIIDFESLNKQVPQEIITTP
jgi:Zn-dependent protease with chaperone function